MPRRDAAATSIVLYPAPARTTSFNAPAASTDSVTFVERTINTSGFDCWTSFASASSFSPGRLRTSQPADFRPSTPDCSNLSAINTRILDDGNSCGTAIPGCVCFSTARSAPSDTTHPSLDHRTVLSISLVTQVRIDAAEYPCDRGIEQRNGSLEIRRERLVDQRCRFPAKFQTSGSSFRGNQRDFDRRTSDRMIGHISLKRRDVVVGALRDPLRLVARGMDEPVELFRVPREGLPVARNIQNFDQ